MENNICWGKQEEILKYKKEHEELNEVLHIQGGYTTDEASFFYHFQSSQTNIDFSSRKFWLKRMTIAFGLDFVHFFSFDSFPKLIDVLKYIRSNRLNDFLHHIPNELAYWGNILYIEDLDEKEPYLKEVPITGLIIQKETIDYQKGYVLTDPSFNRLELLEDEKEFCKKSNLKMQFQDGTFKVFESKLDIYYWLIASCSNNSSFIYELNKVLTLN